MRKALRKIRRNPNNLQEYRNKKRQYLQKRKEEYKKAKKEKIKNQDRNGSMEIHQQGKKEENMYTKQITVEK